MRQKVGLNLRAHLKLDLHADLVEGKFRGGGSLEGECGCGCEPGFFGFWLQNWVLVTKPL
jgi:hypothetical protein